MGQRETQLKKMIKERRPPEKRNPESKRWRSERYPSIIVSPDPRDTGIESQPSDRRQKTKT